RGNPGLCQGDGRVRRNHHLCLEHSRPDPDPAFGDLCADTDTVGRKRGVATGRGFGGDRHGGGAGLGVAGTADEGTRLMLEVAFRHRFPGLALDVAFEAPSGITALFGPSGCGKSTAINAIAGLLRPDQGRIALDGRVLFADRTNLTPQARRIGCVFQDARLFPHMTVEANLRYPSRWRRGAAWDFGRIIGVMALEPLLQRRPVTLSGGERQRAAIGRALLSNPALLVMDEPLAALDEARKAEIMPWLERLRDEIRLPILYVSHSVAEVLRLATTVVLMRQGRVLHS